MKKLIIAMVLTGYLATVLCGCGTPSGMQTTGEQNSAKTQESSSVGGYVDDNEPLEDDNNGDDF